MNDELESIQTAVPGPRSLALGPRLHACESRNVTFLSLEFPVFWESASGSNVVDVDGNRYIDLTAAFGVANAGHSNPAVTAAVGRQAAQLMHGMGDVHPTEVRVRLLERLVSVLPKGLEKAFLATSGSEAVEAALKTALVASGKPNFATYRGAYHGLSLGALQVSGIEKFRMPFSRSIGGDTLLLDYPRRHASLDEALSRLSDGLLARPDVGALIVEPIQGRGGCIVPPDGYLRGVREICSNHDVLLILDEIFTGFGRTGTWFAADREGVVPDVMCVGKALGSGFPIGVAIGTSTVMDAWPESEGEALHTATFLGNPMACAAALATIEEHVRLALPAAAARLGGILERRLLAICDKAIVDVRGRGLCWGVQLRDAQTANAAVVRALSLGAILLQSGEQGDAISIAPPLVISDAQLLRGVDILEAAIAAVA